MSLNKSGPDTSAFFLYAYNNCPDLIPGVSKLVFRKRAHPEMAPPFTFDKVPLIGSAKYSYMHDKDPGIGKFSTLLPHFEPPGYTGTELKRLPLADRKVQIGKHHSFILDG